VKRRRRDNNVRDDAHLADPVSQRSLTHLISNTGRYTATRVAGYNRCMRFAKSII